MDQSGFSMLPYKHVVLVTFVVCTLLLHPREQNSRKKTSADFKVDNGTNRRMCERNLLKVNYKDTRTMSVNKNAEFPQLASTSYVTL